MEWCVLASPIIFYFVSFIQVKYKIKPSSSKCTLWCVFYEYIYNCITTTTIMVRNIFMAPQCFVLPLFSQLFSAVPFPGNQYTPSCQYIFAFLELTLNEIKHLIIFVSVFSLKIKLLKFTHDVVFISSSLPFINKYIIICLFICLWNLDNFQPFPLWIELLGIYKLNSLWGHMFLLFLDKYLRMGLVDCVGRICLTLQESAKLFESNCIIVHPLTAMYDISVTLSSSTLNIVNCLNFSHLLLLFSH